MCMLSLYIGHMAGYIGVHFPTRTHVYITLSSTVTFNYLDPRSVASMLLFARSALGGTCRHAGCVIWPLLMLVELVQGQIARARSHLLAELRCTFEIQIRARNTTIEDCKCLITSMFDNIMFTICYHEQLGIVMKTTVFSHR